MHKPAGSWYVHNDNIDYCVYRPGRAAISETDFAGVSYNPPT